MLPSRAYFDPAAQVPSSVVQGSTPDARQVLVVAVPPDIVEMFPTARFARVTAHNTAEAIRLIEDRRPRAVVVDWDVPDRFDGSAICAAARQRPDVGIMVVMTSPEAAPSALKAGCHAILLKPLSVNLVAARLGRLIRELPSGKVMARVSSVYQHPGTHRTWPEVICPTCSQAGAVCFDHASYRRGWFACLACEGVWVGSRLE